MDDDRHAVAVGGAEHAAELLDVLRRCVIDLRVAEVHLQPVSKFGFLAQRASSSSA